MLIHLDTSDRRPVDNLGRVDRHNVLLGLKHVAQMLWVCARERPDLVYYTLSQNTPALLRDAALVTAARLLHVAPVAQLAGSNYFDIVASGGLTGRLIKSALEQSALVLVLGQRQVRPTLEILHHARVGVAPNGLNTPCVGRTTQKESGVCRLLYLGFLSQAKGVIIALEALARVAQSGRGFRATFAGPWPSAEERNRVLARVADLGLRRLVELPGVVQGVKKECLFRNADVYLLPSFGEGQPLSIIEAMAHSLPVVATFVGAVPDTVVDGRTGILVHPGDLTGLVAAIERFIDDPALRVRMGVAGELRFRECFTATRSHEILRDHFLRVAKLRGTSFAETEPAIVEESR